VATFTNTFDHAMVVEACALRHIPVMMEKPLAVDMKHARAIQQAAARGGIAVIVNYETTWYRSHAEIWKLMKEQKAGGEIRTEAPIAKIIIKNGQAKGVVLANGDEIEAEVVSSSVDPRLTFMKMVGEEHLPEDFVEDIKRYKFRGSSGKVNLALDALPNFTALPGAGPHLRGAVSISPSVDYMERAYDDAKYGRYSRRPYIDIVIPTLTDPSIAPPGKHVMSCFVQYAPYNLKEGNWDEKREEFGDNVIDTIAEHAPNIKDIILHRQVLTPLDLEREFGLSEGNIFQGELTLEQLFFLRPAPGWAQYRSPIKDLYMCGSATHPGGGIMGASGRNAAMMILKDKN